MKKDITIIISLIAILFISLLLPRIYFNAFLARSKSLSSITEINQYVKDPKIKIPTYHMDNNNPYERFAVEDIFLERSKAYGNWDGYNISIYPSKLSNSTCFDISIVCRRGDQNINSDLEWRKDNVTAEFPTSENYPDGEYTRYVGTFQQETSTYTIFGFVFGPIDSNKDKQIIEELSYLIDSLK